MGFVSVLRCWGFSVLRMIIWVEDLGYRSTTFFSFFLNCFVIWVFDEGDMIYKFVYFCGVLIDYKRRTNVCDKNKILMKLQGPKMYYFKRLYMFH